LGNWEFVVIFVLVLIGAGITNLLSGVGRMIREARRVKCYWVHCVWLVVHLFTYLSVWFSYFDDQGEVFGFVEFLESVLAFSLLYLLTVVSFPDFGASEELDLREHFLNTHRAYFSVWALVWLIPGVTVVFGSWEESPGLDELAPLVYFALSVAGVFASSSRTHAALAVAVLLSIVVQMAY
jgi:hypothetical protein